MSQLPTVISVHDQIASCLRVEVHNGVFAPGEPMREEHLAERFGVSRSPIRQVLQQLTYEGLLRSRPNCGTVVAEPPSREVATVLYECRAKLECIALRQCFHELDESDFERWREILSAMYGCCMRGDDGGAYYQDNLFHRLIVTKAAPAGSLGVYSAIAGATFPWTKPQSSSDGAVDVYSAIAQATSEYISNPDNRNDHADLGELYGMHAALYEVFRLKNLELACEALTQHILSQEFLWKSCRLWTEAGKPEEYEGVYDELIPALRRAVARRTNSARKQRPASRQAPATGQTN